MIMCVYIYTHMIMYIYIYMIMYIYMYMYVCMDGWMDARMYVS